MINKNTYVQKFTSIKVSPSPSFLTDGERWIGVDAVSPGDDTVTLSTKDFNRSGLTITVQDQSGDISDDLPIIINTEGGELIDRWPSVILTKPYQAVTMMTSHSEWNILSNVETFILEAASSDVQTPVTINVPLQIKFGADQFDSTYPVSFINRVFTFNQAGMYENDLTFNVIRSDGVGYETIEIQAFVNGEPGVGTPYGSIGARSITTANVIYPINMKLKRAFAEEDTLEFWMVCATVNAAIDINLTPVPTSVVGWIAQGSATNRIYKL